MESGEAATPTNQRIMRGPIRVKGGCHRQADTAAGLPSAPEMRVRLGSYAWCQYPTFTGPPPNRRSRPKRSLLVVEQILGNRLELGHFSKTLRL